MKNRHELWLNVSSLLISILFGFLIASLFVFFFVHHSVNPGWHTAVYSHKAIQQIIIVITFGTVLLTVVLFRPLLRLQTIIRSKMSLKDKER